MSGLEGIQLYIQQTSGGVFKFDEELLSKDADKRSEMSGLSNASEHTSCCFFFFFFFCCFSRVLVGENLIFAHTPHFSI